MAPPSRGGSGSGSGSGSGDRRRDDDMEREMEDMGVPEQCMDECMPDDMCMDCYENLDWENFEDPCADLEGHEMDQCYYNMEDPCAAMCDWDDCEDCWMDHEMRRGMEEIGVPEECMEVCMPDDDCVDCMMQ